MEVIKNFFYGILGVVALFVLFTIIPGVLFSLFTIGCYFIPILLIIKFLYRIFIAGGYIIKCCVAVGVYFAIDYIVQNTESILMIWVLAALVCCIYNLFDYVLNHDTEHIQ